MTLSHASLQNTVTSRLDNCRLYIVSLDKTFFHVNDPHLRAANMESESERVNDRPSILSAALQAHTQKPGLPSTRDDVSSTHGDDVSAGPLFFEVLAGFSRSWTLPREPSRPAVLLLLLHGSLSGVSSSDLLMMIPIDAFELKYLLLLPLLILTSV